MGLYDCGVVVLRSNITGCDSQSTAEPENITSKNIVRSATADEVTELYVIGVLCVVGLLGNLVSFVVLRDDKERRDALFLLQALAVTDCLYLLVAVVRYPVRHLLPSDNEYNLIHPVVYPLLKTCQTITIWMVVLVTVERFVFVCKPMKAPLLFNIRTRRIYTGVVFMGGLLFNVPRFLAICLVKYVNACNGKYIVVHTYRTTFNTALYFDVYIHALNIICLYIIPLAILCVMNARLVRAIRYSRRRSNVLERHDGGATLVLIIIVLVFIVCESPELILRLLTAIDRRLEDVNLFSNAFMHANTFSELLMVINSSINFFIYFIYGRRFRKIFKETFLYKFQSNITAITNELLPMQLPANGNHVAFRGP